MLLDNKPLAGQDSLYASAAIDKKSNELILKIVNASGKLQSRDIQVEGIEKLSGDALLTILKADALDNVNSIVSPLNVKPIEEHLKLKGKKISLPLAPYSFTVMRVKIS
jgi:alpha-L-arabinofuranosidase